LTRGPRNDRRGRCAIPAQKCAKKPDMGRLVSRIWFYESFLKAPSKQGLRAAPGNQVLAVIISQALK
jgi:hypothetical protein